jgi:hypothetical protein
MATIKRLGDTTGARGMGADIQLQVDGLFNFLRIASQAYPEFNKELRMASEEIAQVIVDQARVNAAGQPKHGKTVRGSSGMSQAQVVVNGLRARRDRVPTIKLDHNKLYPSKSRNNRSRGLGMMGPARFGAGESSPYRGFDRKVTYGDVFWGAEFGGRRRKTTQQFLRHRGRQGYFFWQAVRDKRSYISKAYDEAIVTILKTLASGAK